MWQNGHAGQRSVCASCAGVGLSPRDAQRYPCSQCGNAYGHMKFNKVALADFKRPGRDAKLSCEQCKLAATDRAVAAKVRQTRLLSILKRKEAYRCTCKPIPRGQRAYHALYLQVHTESCRLHPNKMGEKVWDGKNEGITLDDLRFLCERKAY